jgi:hypothetical protein
MKKAILIGVLVVVLVVSIGCRRKADVDAERAAIPTDSQLFSASSVYRYERFVDEKAGVVCYAIVGIAIDCLPLADTKLPRG